MTQFSKQSTRPLSAAHMRRAAAKLHQYADAIEANCEPETKIERTRLTNAIFRATGLMRSLDKRYREFELTIIRCEFPTPSQSNPTHFSALC